MAESHASPGTAKLCSQLPGAVEVPEVPSLRVAGQFWISDRSFRRDRTALAWESPHQPLCL